MRFYTILHFSGLSPKLIVKVTLIFFLHFIKHKTRYKKRNSRVDRIRIQKYPNSQQNDMILFLQKSLIIQTVQKTDITKNWYSQSIFNWVYSTF